MVCVEADQQGRLGSMPGLDSTSGVGNNVAPVLRGLLHRVSRFDEFSSCRQVAGSEVAVSVHSR